MQCLSSIFVLLDHKDVFTKGIVRADGVPGG